MATWTDDYLGAAAANHSTERDSCARTLASFCVARDIDALFRALA